MPVDVRILSATHKNLAEMVATGQFREDLYYRINVIELQVPPLRDRDDDVFLLTDRLLTTISRAMQLPRPTLSADARQKLAGYRFPGNVRELENMLERALTLCENDTITAADIQVKDMEHGADDSVAAGGTPDLGNTLQDVERAEIMKALEETRFNKTAAAKKLGLSLRALRYRIQKLDIE